MGHMSIVLSLLIDSKCFEAADLGNPVVLDKAYDLALCLEVAEHLPQERAPGLIADLVKAAPVILFSAAIPAQGGTNHVNEQWPSYWAKLFRMHGYRAVDALRPLIRSSKNVAFWYRQNAVLYIDEQRAKDYSALSSAIEKTVDFNEEWVYGRHYEKTLARFEEPLPVGRLVNELRNIPKRALRRLVRGKSQP